MTALQLAMASGALVALGVVLLVWRVLPAEPDLTQALDRLAPLTARGRDLQANASPSRDVRERVGAWALANIPGAGWASVSDADLAILRISRSRLSGEMVLGALAGLLVPTITVGLLRLLGAVVGMAMPAVVAMGLAAAFFILPARAAKERAGKAREEFRRALGAYLDLVALERHNGSDIRQALERAAEVGDSWAFHRLQEELQRSVWIGSPPWAGLHALAREVDLPELGELADIMRISGEAGALTVDSLRARAVGLRTAMLTEELGRSNDAEERRRFPAYVILALLMAMVLLPIWMNVSTMRP
ncbi:MAG TPA: hypothetical protein P5314_14250 [Tetrasphaera sp.]|nr:hypothetical protein [Tetrasphaera sp.]